MSQRLGTLATLTAALASIDQAHGDAEILKAYEGSSRVLKEILSRGELQEENVDRVMEDLKIQMEGAESVRRAVEEGGWEVVEAAGYGGKEELDEEVEKELERLVEEEKKGVEEGRLIDVMRRLEVEGEKREKMVSPGREKVAELVA